MQRRKTHAGVTARHKSIANTVAITEKQRQLESRWTGRAAGTVQAVALPLSTLALLSSAGSISSSSTSCPLN